MIEKKTKVFYLITGLNPGGAENMLKKIIFKMYLDKYEISVCTITNIGSISKLIKPYVKNIYYLNVQNLFDRIKAVIKLRKIIRKEKPDILHCFMIHANLLGRIASIGLNIKVVSSIRVKLKQKKYLPLLIIDRLTQSLVDIYIVNSKALFNFTVSQGITLKKIKLIENGLDFKKFKLKKSPDKIKKELNLSNLPVITMIAHNRKQKDYPTMISALNQLRKIKEFYFLAVGIDTESLINVFKKQHYDLSLNNIKLLGFRDDIPDILSITNIWVCSTLFEGQSNSLLEAMAMRKPIITTDILENSEVVREGKEALLVPPKSPNIMARAIETLMNDKHLSNQIAENAFKRVHNKYNINNTINKLEKLYDLLIS